MKNKILIFLLVGVMCFSTSITSLALNDNKSEENIEICANDVNISNKQKETYETISKKLANTLSNDPDEKEIKKVIKDFTSETKIGDIQENIVEDISNSVNEEINSNETPNIELSEDFKEEYENTYKVDEDTNITINPLYIEISDIQEEDGEEMVDEDTSLISKISDFFVLKVNAASKTKTKKYSEKKAYYSWVGIKIFTVGLDCNFYYNGSKAWYKSGFDGWYKRGTLSIWQVSNWKEKREQSGKSYVARCSGNFHYGLEVHGVGLIIQDLYIKHVATCNKNGKVSLSRTCK